MPEAEKHIARLHEVIIPPALFESKNEASLFLILDYVPLTLEDLMEGSEVVKLEEGDIKLILYKFMCSLHFLHSAGVMHRDIKPANILVDSNLNIKICDFGFARSTLSRYSPTKRRLSIHVCTRQYRPPEICLMEKKYDSKVDMWGAGCVIAELMNTSTRYSIGTS